MQYSIIKLYSILYVCHLLGTENLHQKLISPYIPSPKKSSQCHQFSQSADISGGFSEATYHCIFKSFWKFIGSDMAKGRNLYNLVPGEGHILQAFQEKFP